MIKRKTKPENDPSTKNIQPGFVVKIKREPARANITGFLVGTEHIIQQPPEHGVNTQAGIWLKDKRGRLRYLFFPYWIALGRKEILDKAHIWDDPGYNSKAKSKLIEKTLKKRKIKRKRV